MAEGGVQDISSVVNHIENMFGNAIDREAIICIVESCAGDLYQSVDAAMKITVDSCTLQPNIETVSSQNQAVPRHVPQDTFSEQSIPLSPYVTGTPSSHEIDQHQPVNKSPSSSYSKAMQSSKNYQNSSGNESIRPPIPRYETMPNQRPSSTYPPSSIIWNNQIKRIIENHNRGSRTLVLMRGAPGSGKTTLAEKIIEMLIGGSNQNFKTYICSTDDYFMCRGKYMFNKSNLNEAHNWNKKRVRVALQQGLSPIIVDNTNIELWEMDDYVKSGVENGYILEVVEPRTPWAKNPNQLAKKNIHNVPLHSIKRMVDNYAEGLTGDLLVQKCRVSYPPNKTPPVLRSMPAFHPPDSESKISSHSEVNFGASTSQGLIQTPKSTSGIRDSNNEQVTDLTQGLETVDLASNPVQDVEDIDTEKMVEGLIHDQESEIQGNVCGNNDSKYLEFQKQLDQSEKVEQKKMVEGLIHDQESEIQGNVCINNDSKYLEFQKQLDQIEKVEQEWENGESWEEKPPTPSTSTDKDDESATSPKPPRATSPKLQTDADKKLKNVINNCQDWSQISLFLPPWTDTNEKPADPIETVVEMSTSSTCMELGDFDVNNTSHKIISASPRNINEYHISFKREKIPEQPMFDKSTSTNEELLINAPRRCKNEEFHFSYFRKLFITVSRAALRDIFEQCMGNINWAVDIVLDGLATNKFQIVEEESDEEEIVDNFELCSCLSYYNIVPDPSPEPEPVVKQEYDVIVAVTESTGAFLKKTNKRDVKVSDASLQLKRQIEQNVMIAENHYSKHCLKVKKWRHGDFPTDEQVVEENQDVNQPSTSKALQQRNENTNCSDESDDENSNDDESTASVEELEKTVNVILGKEFISELDALFGRTDMSYPDSIMPKINMPLSLLNEINALWMESLMHQMDEQERQAAKMLQEDEEFARVLAMKEAELAVTGKQPEVLNFKEIMDMDYALSLYQRDVAEWKNKEPNDLAAKLSREKLYNLFPELDKDTLAELLVAHENNFQCTVEVLLVSIGKGNLLKEKDGLNNFVTQKEMERQKKILEEEKKALSEVEWPLLPRGEIANMEVVNNYRSTADRHLKIRNLNIQKASDYVRRGMITVGSYYRELAEFHKLKYEQSNSLAAASLMQLHASNCPDSATIDLHYLRVGEAKESLDLFIDTHIQKLKSLQGQGARQHTLYFITGRGLHSNGRPKVKPAVKKRLRERGLYFNEVNPGLLSAKVCADDKLTHQVA